jgi:hypothetical protein
MNTRPSVTPDVLKRFGAYVDAHIDWGSLHIALEDGNLQDQHVKWCADYARRHDDAEGAALADLLLSMSRTQRRRIMREAGNR